MACSLKLTDIPAPVLTRAKLHILDALGLGLASTVQDYGHSAVAGIKAMGAQGNCSVIGQTQRFDLRDAAMANGVLIHGLDFDDTHLGSIIHPTCTALPVAMALGEHIDASGAQMLLAFLAGAETGIRIGLAVDGGFHHVGYHATGIVAHFASAVTAGKLLGLDADQLTSAQGITGSTASGTQVFLEEGAWTKRFHPGWGAVAGITAAYLAQSDFKGPTRPYEGKFGLFATHMHEPAKLERMADALGEHWHFGETALKPYPVCHFIHGCADAAIDLHGEISRAEIAQVTAFLPQPTLHIVAEPHDGKAAAKSDYEVKFSAQHVIAACLLRGRFGMPDLLPAAIADPKVRDLSQLVICVADPDSQFPTYFSGGLEVNLTDGRILHRHVPVNSGAGDRALDEAEVSAKFFASASLAIGQDRAARIRKAVFDLENVSVRDLLALLRL